MLSDREKQWIGIGGSGALGLLYLWLVLFPLIGTHARMRRRIARGWQVMQKLEKEIRTYTRIAQPVSDLLQHAAPADQKIDAKGQLRLLIRQTMGPEISTLSLRFSTVWEGDQVTLYRCHLKGRASPRRVIKLIQHLDHSYRPARVAAWHLKNLSGGRGTLDMEIYFLDGAKR